MDFAGSGLVQASRTVDIKIVVRFRGGIKSGNLEFGGSKITDATVGNQDIETRSDWGGNSWAVWGKMEVGVINGGGYAKIGENLECNGGAAKTDVLAEKMMHAGIKTEVEPFDAVLVGFKVFVATVKIKINIF